MNKLKCPNCGAPISVENNKCPYCDISYFDLSFIDINNNEPFYLKIKMGKMTLTQLVRILPDDINIELKQPDQCYCCDSFGNKLFTFVTSNNEMFTNLKFEAVTDPSKNRLCTVTYEE